MEGSYSMMEATILVSTMAVEHTLVLLASLTLVNGRMANLPTHKRSLQSQLMTTCQPLLLIKVSLNKGSSPFLRVRRLN